MLLVAADRMRVHVDVFLKNEATTPVEIRRFEVAGSAKSTTNCLDVTPSLSITLTSLLPTGQLDIADVYDRNTKFFDSVTPTGGFEVLPCQQCRVKIAIPILLKIAGGEERKIRFTLPRVSRIGGTKLPAIDQWELLDTRLLSGDGHVVSASVR